MQVATSEVARWLTAKVNAADLVGGVSLGDKEEMVAEVSLDLSQTVMIDHSTEIALHSFNFRIQGCGFRVFAQGSRAQNRRQLPKSRETTFDPYEADKLFGHYI
ncbi:MAG: hypothetical protein ACU843_15920 [Gammaproteobacteria bacterium]